MNESLLRMAMVINTSYDSFLKNLSNIIVYILYSEGNQRQYDINQIRDEIKNEVFLEFTYDEIKEAIKSCENERQVVNINGKFVLDSEGYKKITENSNLDIKKLIERYIDKYNIISYSHEQIFQSICGYLYNLLNNNIKELMNLLDIGNKEDLKISMEDESYSNEQRKIINDFLDWNDLDKDKVVFRLIAFSVDYCRLTTKKKQKCFLWFIKREKILFGC